MKAKWCILAVVVFSLVVAHSVGFAAQTGPTISYNRSLRFQGFSTYASDGELGLYLIGTWDHSGWSTYAGSENVYSLVSLINPTAVTLGAFVTFWSDDEFVASCDYVTISPNGTGLVTKGNAINTYFRGAIKVLVVGDTVNPAQPEIGLVGFRKEVHDIGNCGGDLCNFTAGSLSQSEVRLQPVPWKVLSENKDTSDAFADEILRIKGACGQ